MISVIRPSQPTRKRVVRDAELARAAARAHRRGARSRASRSSPSRITAIFSRRRDAQLDEVVPHLRADRDQRVGDRASAARSAGRRGAAGREVARAGRGRGTCGRRLRGRAEPESSAATRPTAPAFAVCVWSTSGRSSSDQLKQMPDRGGVRRRARSPAGARRCRAGSTPSSLGEVLHRALARARPAGDERRLVAALGRARGQVRDVKRRAADVQARDDAQDADRLGCGITRRS